MALCICPQIGSDLGHRPCTLHTVNSTLHNAHFTMHTAHCTLTMNTEHCTLQTEHCKLHMNTDYCRHHYNMYTALHCTAELTLHIVTYHCIVCPACGPPYPAECLALPYCCVLNQSYLSCTVFMATEADIDVQYKISMSP